ncbi:hypothetical protein THAOC_14403, partial [Thalassiosira oceanica]
SRHDYPTTTASPTWNPTTASPTDYPTTASPTVSPAPTLAPTPKPTDHHAGGCHPAYSAGASYAAGQQVSATATAETPTTTPCTCSEASCPSNPGQTTGCTKTTTVMTSETYNYQCVDSSNPNWHYCSSSGYKPTGEYGSLAWVKGTQCSGVITPVDPLAGIANPPGCPEDFVAGTEYEPDAKVSTPIAGYSGPAKQIFICETEPMNQFCGKSGYGPGTGQYWDQAWTKGTLCSGSVSPTASPSWDAAMMIDGCPGAWAMGNSIYEPGDRVSKNGIVFECSDGSPHCSSEGYEPDVDAETDYYWKLVWTVVGHCTGTIAPTGSPTFDQATVIGCPDEWVKGTTYEEDDLAAVTVSSTPLRKIAYKCKKWPFSGHCKDISPAEEFGGHLGWTKVGGCAGTVSPTAAPSFDALALVGGCPDNYSTTAEYEAGDRVAFQAAAGTAGSMALAAGWRFIVYECKGWPSTSYCSQDAYKPGSQYDDMAWTVKGHCDGTLSPTVAPTAYVNADCPAFGTTHPECTYEANTDAHVTTIPQCKYNKEVEVTGVACTCGDSGCPTPSPTSTTCTKTVTRISCPAVNNWSSGVSYVEGDVVRVGANMYTCKEWPYYFNCNKAAYTPTTDPDGLWKQAWTESGTCPSSC